MTWLISLTRKGSDVLQWCTACASNIKTIVWKKNGSSSITKKSSQCVLSGRGRIFSRSCRCAGVLLRAVREKTAEKSFKRSHFTELGNSLNAGDQWTTSKFPLSISRQIHDVCCLMIGLQRSIMSTLLGYHGEGWGMKKEKGRQEGLKMNQTESNEPQRAWLPSACVPPYIQYCSVCCPALASS